MQYDPILQKWIGNDQDLNEFDTIKVSKPSLIPHKTETNPITVGQMTFDPIRMRWTGNDEDSEEARIFDSIADLEIKKGN
jgi:hypothetical protein